MYKDLIECLESRLGYYKNQNTLINNQDHISAADYKWMAANNATIANLNKWKRMLENAGKGE